MEQQEEVWKACVAWPRYEVSSVGRVRTTAGRILGQATGGWCKYLSVNMKRGEKPTKVLVHRLVIEAFIGPLGGPERLEGHHRDGCKTNNRVENLDRVTRSDNLRHAYADGFQPRRRIKRPGELSSRHKLRQGEVELMLYLASKGIRGKTLAKMFVVSEPTVSMIRSGKRWSHSIRPVAE